MHLGKFPDSMEFQSWKVNFKAEACVNSQFSHSTMKWITEVEMAKSIDDLNNISFHYWANRFPRLRLARCEDCVCLEKAHHEYALPTKNEYRRAPSSKRDSILTREANDLYDL